MEFKGIQIFSNTVFEFSTMRASSISNAGIVINRKNARLMWF
jgi:hypothetical protein